MKGLINKNINLNLHKTSDNLLFKIQKRGILTYAPRRVRVMAQFNFPNVGVDELTYYKQMKVFIKETQGVPINSQKWIELRNKHYKILSDKHKEQEKVISHESQETSYLRFYVVLVPESTYCYELVSILNYYNIIYKAV